MGSHLLYLYPATAAAAASRASRVKLLSAFSPSPVRMYCETSKENSHHHHETWRAPSLAEEFERVAEEFEKIAEEKTHQGTASETDTTLGEARDEAVKEQPLEKGKFHETGDNK